MDDAALVEAAGSVNELRLRALRGELSTILLASIDRLKKTVVPSSKLAVFASSTFTDTVKERNLLLEKILPDLRERGRAMGIEVIFVDMRWGVRDENTLDHQTWIACRRELLRCYNESGGLFFLSLQSDKYGCRGSSGGTWAIGLCRATRWPKTGTGSTATQTSTCSKSLLH